MNEKPEYAELAEVLARHIHGYWLKNWSPDKLTFQHVFQSNLQIAAVALEKLKIIKSIDAGQTSFVFTCEPDEFRQIAQKNKKLGCSYDTLVLPIYSLLESSSGGKKGLFDCLVKLQLCRQARSGDFTPDTNGKIRGFSVEGLDYELAWTEKKTFYDHLYSDWTSLIK